MKRLFVAAVLMSALLPLAPASAESQSYIGVGTDLITYCPLPEVGCFGGWQAGARGGVANVSVFDDIHGSMVGASAQAIHPSEVAPGDPLVPARVIVEFCGSGSINVPGGWELVIFLRGARPGHGLNPAGGDVEPNPAIANRCFQQHGVLNHPTTGSISI